MPMSHTMTEALGAGDQQGKQKDLGARRSSTVQAAEWLATLDANHDGVISESEMREAAFFKNTLKNLRSVFDVVDHDKSGFLDRGEMAEVLKMMGKSGMQIRLWIKTYDIDNNQKITFSEFCTWFKNDMVGKIDPELVIKSMNNCKKEISRWSQGKAKRLRQMGKDKMELKEIDRHMAVINDKVKRIEKQQAGLAKKLKERDELKALIAKLTADQALFMAAQRAALPNNRALKATRMRDMVPARPDYLKTGRARAPRGGRVQTQASRASSLGPRTPRLPPPTKQKPPPPRGGG
jgi:hypothetical protein